ncbi:hypothetical protein KPH14_007024 [Odynerus spinipes]|uniref:Uncharacterized protein n=1 Tax=Odynerus spinipes TaxID=1348599 RepID=A0AAD9RRT7_9HYME|nr:hypothetical protein KPH14_007024 [Odynerus spinipes]
MLADYRSPLKPYSSQRWVSVMSRRKQGAVVLEPLEGATCEGKKWEGPPGEEKRVSRRRFFTVDLLFYVFTNIVDVAIIEKRREAVLEGRAKGVEGGWELR